MKAISLNNVSFSYSNGGRRVLSDVKFGIEDGEYVALLGLNGSGKSTLLRLMVGFFEPTEGTCESAARPAVPGQARGDKHDAETGIVFQQPKEQIVAGVVERDTAFGPQNLLAPAGEVELRTIECLACVSLLDKALSRTTELSLGETQRLAFAGILALHPSLLLLDEATAMLDVASKEQLLASVDAFNRRGGAVVHATHDLDEALRARRIIVLDAGRVVFDGRPEGFAETDAFALIFGEGGGALSFAGIAPPAAPCAEGGAPALRVQNLSASYGEHHVFEGVSFELMRGTVTALTGPSGCGKSTLFECLSGLKRADSGAIFAASWPPLALQESDAALFERLCADDVAFGPRNAGLRGRELLERVKSSMDVAGVPYEEFGDKTVFSLSGGERKKLSIAGLIALGSDILIFDEPTAGLDAPSRRSLLKTFRALALEGKTVLFSTHRVGETEAADRVLEWNALACGGEGAAPRSAAAAGGAGGGAPQGARKGGGAGAAREGGAALEELSPIKNASMLDTISRAAAVFTAPREIPPSPVSRLRPAAKTLLFLAIFIASLASHDWRVCLAALALCVIYSRIAKYPVKTPLSVIARLVPWIAVFTLISVILFPVYEGDAVLFSWGIFTVTDTKLLLFTNAFLHAMSAVFAVGTYIYTTSEREIMDSIAVLLSPLAALKVPTRYAVLVVGIIFRFIPLLLEEFSAIIKTQIIRGSFAKARGAAKLRALISVFVPLVLRAVRKSQCLADALTARYF